MLFNAVRAGKFSMKELERAILPTIASLNGPAMEIALQYDLHACTDVTGFGMLGHLLEVASGSGTHAVLTYHAIPFYPGAHDMYKKGQTTGSNKANRKLVAKSPLHVQVSMSQSQEELLYDPQTSGGLLLALPEDQAKKLLQELHSAGIDIAAKVGEIVEGAVGITIQ